LSWCLNGLMDTLVMSITFTTRCLVLTLLQEREIKHDLQLFDNLKSNVKNASFWKSSISNSPAMVYSVSYIYIWWISILYYTSDMEVKILYQSININSGDILPICFICIILNSIRYFSCIIFCTIWCIPS
jgi:hypothetical protein